MSVNKYIKIYNYLKENIISQEFKAGQKIPSENELKNIFNVSRNTVRRAIEMLVSEGYLTSIHGKGVFVMEKQPLEFLVGGLQSIKEASITNNINYITKVAQFETLTIDENLSKKTGFSIGTDALKILRVRNIESEDVILDVNYFNLNAISGITKEIAEDSIYEYIEKNLKLKISGAKKIVSVVPSTNIDKKYLNLNNCNLVAVIKNYVYLDNGALFEYTESRHRPDRFNFNTFARRS